FDDVPFGAANAFARLENFGPVQSVVGIADEAAALVFCRRLHVHAGGAARVFVEVRNGIDARGAHVPEIALHDDILLRAAEENVPDSRVANFLELARMTMKAGAKTFWFQFLSDLAQGIGN